MIPYYFSKPENLLFEWVISDMTKKSVRFKLRFKTALFVSSEEVPDVLKFTFRDKYMFVGVNNLPISNQPNSRRALEDDETDEGGFVTMERQLP